MLEAAEYYLTCARSFAWGSFYLVLGLFMLVGAAHTARVLYNECSG